MQGPLLAFGAPLSVLRVRRILQVVQPRPVLHFLLIIMGWAISSRTFCSIHVRTSRPGSQITVAWFLSRAGHAHESL